MGRLSGFRYREIVRILKRLGFEFHRQAAGSHEIWFNPDTLKFTTIPNHPSPLPKIGTGRDRSELSGLTPASMELQPGALSFTRAAN